MLAGDGGRAGIRADKEYARIGDGLVDGHHDVREGDAGNDGYVLAFEQFGGGLNADIGFELVVFADDFDGNPAQLAAFLLNGQHEGIVLILAQRTARPRHGGNEADFHGLLGVGGGADDTAQHGGSQGAVHEAAAGGV